ncbi:hypothetical protein V6N12_044443 [Hibiscus sabdariffa]|uniref:Uncharacterized protein n=1 Tax=Hibiscus sabdariffa TaxID=183260 RepID=A0ABR2BPN1_9ROSI
MSASRQMSFLLISRSFHSKLLQYNFLPSGPAAFGFCQSRSILGRLPEITNKLATYTQSATTIISDFKFNVGEVIAKELSEACQNDKGILAFPCIISALYRRAAVPTRPKDKFTPLQTGWTRKEYMHKMDLTDVVPIQMAMPITPASHQSPAETPAPSTVEAQNDTPAANPMESPAHTPEAHASFASTPTTPPSPPAANPPAPAPTIEPTPSIQLLELRNQLQRVEAR